MSLMQTTDILAGLVKARTDPRQILVGFAAETADLAANARSKLAAKSLDMIVANDVGAPATGFGHDTNAVTIFVDDGQEVSVPLTDKRAVAAAVLEQVVARRAQHSSI